MTTFEMTNREALVPRGYCKKQQRIFNSNIGA